MTRIPLLGIVLLSACGKAAPTPTQFALPEGWRVTLDSGFKRQGRGTEDVLLLSLGRSYACSAYELLPGESSAELIERLAGVHAPNPEETFENGSAGRAALIRDGKRWALIGWSVSGNSVLISKFGFGRREDLDWALAAWRTVRR